MKLIPAGKVTVADPAGGPAKEIEIGPLYFAETETVWDAYDIFVFALDNPDPGATSGADAVTRPSKPYVPPDRGYGHSGYAALSLSAHGAAEYCRWLSEKTGRTYRLPTEAEWQYACLAGSPGPYSWGSEAAAAADHAWFKDNAGPKTHPVAQKKPNAWGLFDMHGNAAEWTTGLDGKPVVKGGSFKDGVEGLRAQSRVKQTPDWNSSDPQFPKSKWWLADCTFVGFRVVCESPEDVKQPDNKKDAPDAPKR
jgi:hypothetical protein